YLRPDAKSQVTLEYGDDNKPKRVVTIVLSTQHDDFIKPENNSSEAKNNAEKAMQDQIKKDIVSILIPRLLKKYPQYQPYFNNESADHGNPPRVLIIGGPHAGTGLTGRKLIVDPYGGKGAHGGAAGSGKGPGSADRPAAHPPRSLAKELVAVGVAAALAV